MGGASSSARGSANVIVPGWPPAHEGRLMHAADSHPPSHNVCATSVKGVSPINQDVIAIVGIGCRAPGADNIRDFWRLLQNGENHVVDVPADRWNAAAFLDPDPTAPGKAYVQKGGFMKDIRGFDNELYGINDFEATQMDPQQCLLLDCTNMALQDAGFTRKQISGSKTGVFIGSMNNDYAAMFHGKTTKLDNYTGTGISSTIQASRLSYVFNLQGPCMVLDTACSASLVAIHQGCLAIYSGDCEQAICGGVNCMLSPDLFVQLSKARMISPTGQCHAFSDKADGYTRGEGCGVVILKRLDDALRDGDKVWATVRTGTNQDGHTVTPMTAPSGDQQKKLLHSVYNRFQVEVNQLDYIEAHGTGTQAGDPVEVNALGSFFKEQGPPRDRYIGSVKTNIGHTESAAGVLGLIKVLLMMKHSMIVPSLHCIVVNPKLDLSDLRLIVPTKSVPWANPQKIAACNSFGFGGSNGHAVLWSFSAPTSKDPPQKKQRCIVCFSGKTRKSLKGSLEDLDTDDEAPLLNVHNVSYTSTVRRDHHTHRVAFVVDDMQDLLTAVGEQLSRDQWSLPSPRQPNVVFVFCGMGTAWDGMCRQLLIEHQTFKDTILQVETHLSAYVPWSLIERLQQEDPSEDPVLAPIAIFACQVGLTAVWRSLGIQPSCVVGQSIGEVAAAYTAGCLSLADAVKIIYHRSQLLAQVTGGAMVIVQNVEVDKVRQLLNGMQNKATVALEYSPRACAISADFETMQSLRPHLLSNLKSTHKDMRLLDLDVSVAYHSCHVDKSADQLTKLIQGVTPKAPSVTFLSTVTGKVVKGPLHARHWVDNMKKPVLFHQAMIESVPSKTSSNTVFLEIGPQPVLRAHMDDLFPNGRFKTVPSVTKQSEIKSLFLAVSALYECGAEIEWTNLETQGNKVTDVPRYSFDKKHLKEKTEPELVLCSGVDIYRKNHLYVYPTEETPMSFRLFLSPLTIPSVYHHVVMGTIFIPGAMYAECGFAVAKYSHTTAPVSVSVEFQQLLSLKKDEIVDLEILRQDPESETDSRETQFVIRKNEKQLATLRMMEGESKPREPVNLDFLRTKCTEMMTKSSIYAILSKLGFEYGEAFRLLEYAYRNSNECLATLQVNDIVRSEMSDTTIHPCILDCMLHSTAFVLVGGDKVPVKETLPKFIARLSVHGQMETTMHIHVRLKSTGSKFFIFDQKLLSVDGHVIAEITDFLVQVLTAEEEESMPAMLAIQWTKAKDTVPEMFGNTRQGHEKKILLVSEVPVADSADHVTLLKYNRNNESQSLKKDLEAFLATHAVDVLVFWVSRSQNTEEADIMQSRLVNTCLLIQTVFIVLSERFLRVPFYVFTLDAWPSVSGSHQRDVSPTATALWGLLRTAVDEHVYDDITAVELHSSSDRLTCQSLQSLLDFLMTDADVADYPEVLITEEAVYVNQVVEVSSSVSVPRRRFNPAASMKDVRGNAVILSKEATKLSQLQAVIQERAPSSEHHTTLRCHTFAQPPEKLFNTRVSSSHLLPKRLESSSDYVVMALEVTGHAVGGTGEDLTSCCPLTVGPEVSVSMHTTIDTACIPQYQAGDLSKLVLFWALVERVPTRQFTILTSKGITMHLAQLLKLLSCNVNERRDSDVNIVMIEELKENASCKESLLSLVLIDVDTMSVVAKHWKDPHSLVSCCSLVNGDVQAFVACVLPDAELSLVNTQLIFQLPHLKRLLPDMKEWIRKHSGLMTTIANHIHCKDVGDSGTGIHALLRFNCLHFNGLSIRLEEDKLFRKDGAYLVVGGLTGLGWICVDFLAQHNAGYVAIINRRAPRAEQIVNMKQLSHLHDCQIKSFQADIASMKSLEQAMQLMSEEWSERCQLRGVFTGAAVVQDGSFPLMDRSAFENVLSPKVRGTWNLHRLTKDLPLDYFVMHSSVAAVLGNQGQANYSAANSFLDGLAFHRRHLGLAAQTINWGPLDTGLLDNRDTLKEKLGSMGFHVASRREILDALLVQLLLNWVQTIPVKLNRELYANRIRGTLLQPLMKRFQHLLSGPSQAISSVTNIENAEKIRFLEPTQRLREYEAFVKELVARILSMDVALVTSDANILDLGLDSVTGMMLLNIIQRSTSFKLPAAIVLSGETTVSSLALALDDFARETVE